MKKVQPKELAKTGSPATQNVSAEIVARVILNGDLAGLTADQKVDYYTGVCTTVGLNPSTKPFDYIRLNGKEVLYANKGCAEQLRNIHHVSIKIVAREKIEDVYIVTAEATDKAGRTDSATGCVPVAGLKGDFLANAFMKAETKAKRRVTLSICGLNMLDEVEVETIPAAAAQMGPAPAKAAEPRPLPEPKAQAIPPVNQEATRDELARQIIAVGGRLNLRGKALVDFIKEETGKETKDLLHSEMESVLEKLQCEMGRQ